MNHKRPMVVLYEGSVVGVIASKPPDAQHRQIHVAHPTRSAHRTEGDALAAVLDSMVARRTAKA